MAISAITTHGNYMLRIDIEDFNGNKKYALYNTFFVGGETDNFKLTIGGYTGDAGIVEFEKKIIQFFFYRIEFRPNETGIFSNEALTFKWNIGLFNILNKCE